MTSDIPFIRPTFPEPAEFAAEYAEIIENNWFSNFGPKEQQFRRALEKYVGHDVHAATFGNGTLALMAAVQACLGHGRPGQRLLMPSFTFVAVAQAAIWNGYQPLFIDVDADTWQPSIDSAREALARHGDEVAGVLLTNAFGVGNPQIDAWEALAGERGLPLVIDSAAGFGSRYVDGAPVGSRGTCEIFSFHATKPFAVGEGGALVSRDPEVVRRVTEFQNFGFDASRASVMLGLNGKLSEFGAAVGLRQLPGLDDRLASRQRVFARYVAELADEGLQFQHNAASSSLCFASVTCVDTDHKQRVLSQLESDGVQARDYYNPPIHRHPYFADVPALTTSMDLSVTSDLCARIVSLPVHDRMPDAQVERVIRGARVGTRR